jgi:hypothetical protein
MHPTILAPPPRVRAHVRQRVLAAPRRVDRLGVVASVPPLPSVLPCHCTALHVIVVHAARLRVADERRACTRVASTHVPLVPPLPVPLAPAPRAQTTCSRTALKWFEILARSNTPQSSCSISTMTAGGQQRERHAPWTSRVRSLLYDLRGCTMLSPAPRTRCALSLISPLSLSLCYSLNARG